MRTNIVIKSKHVAAFFSIAITVIMPFTLATEPLEDGRSPLWLSTSFYILYYLFVAGIIIYNFLEYRSLDVNSYSFRNFNLWAPVFINSPAIFAFMPAVLLLITMISPLIVLMLIVFSLIGKQPKFTDGRFYPVIFGFLSFIWIFIFFGETFP